MINAKKTESHWLDKAIALRAKHTGPSSWKKIGRIAIFLKGVNFKCGKFLHGWVGRCDFPARDLYQSPSRDGN